MTPEPQLAQGPADRGNIVQYTSTIWRSTCHWRWSLARPAWVELTVRPMIRVQLTAHMLSSAGGAVSPC